MKYIIALITTFILISGYGQSLEFRSSGRLVLGTLKEKTASVGLGDIDNDGDIDIVTANGRHWPQQNRVFFNSGKGIFTVSQSLDIASETSYATELADFDMDGDLDVAIGNDNAPNTQSSMIGKEIFLGAEYLDKDFHLRETYLLLI